MAGPKREAAIGALDDETTQPENTILKQVLPGTNEFEKAKTKAVPGRILLDVKRGTGKLKARAVKQGFKENKHAADGPDFSYYSSVAKLVAVRCALFRPQRGNRRIATKDIRGAFNQSDAFPDGKYKYVCFRNPVKNEWQYYRQYGPLYGENSAPRRWENTLSDWFESVGFRRGENEKSTFYHETRDLLVLTYVDDLFMDGDEDDVRWISDIISKRFDCKHTEWLTKETPIDFLGMMISINSEGISLSMENYVEQMLTGQ